MKITVIGCGRWGSFITWYLDQIGHAVTLYGKESSRHMQEFRHSGTNGLVTLRESVHLESDLAKAMESNTIVISVPSQAFRGLLCEIKQFDLAGKTFVLCMKGIEIESGERLSQVFREEIGDLPQLAVWLGPGHVQEFIHGIPNCMVIDSDRDETKNFLIDQFKGPLIRFYYGADLIGNEIGAAAKNVIGIAAGILDGIGLTSLKGALMSRGTREIARLIEKMGGKELSAYGLCHLGDYEATVFSPYSHNRMFGEKFAKGEAYSELAEGYYTAKALKLLGEKVGVDLPICNAVYTVLYEGSEIRSTLDSLFLRSLKNEF